MGDSRQPHLQISHPSISENAGKLHSLSTLPNLEAASLKSLLLAFVYCIANLDEASHESCNFLSHFISLHLSSRKDDYILEEIGM